MKDYDNFVARMGSFDMDLTPPKTDEDLLNDTLEHFGVKGMKWGVRKRVSGVKNGVKREVGSFKRERSQLNIKDPSKMTDDELKSTLNRNRLENQFKAEVKKTTTVRNSYSEEGRARKAANRNAYLDRASLSDKDLQAKVNRIRSENQLVQEANRVNRKTLETGSSFMAGVSSSLVKDMISGKEYTTGQLITNALISGSVDATKTYAKETKAETNRYNKPYGQEVDNE